MSKAPAEESGRGTDDSCGVHEGAEGFTSTMKAGWVEMTVPEKPNSRLQKYRRVAEGVFSEDKPDRAQPVPTR